MDRGKARGLRILLVLILSVLITSSILWADKLSPDRLLERAIRHWPPEFREANAKALVAGYIILGRPLDELVGPALEAIHAYGTHELWEALQAGLRGEHITICYRPEEVEDYLVKEEGKRLSQMTIEELERITLLEGVSDEVRQAAATLLVQRAIAAWGMEPGSSWYAFRVAHELDLFDPLKLQLQDWMLGSQSPELVRATVLPLSQMYLAEHFVWWEWDKGGKGRYHMIIQGQLECPEPLAADGDGDGDGERGEGRLLLDWPMFRRDPFHSGLAPGSGRISRPIVRWEVPVHGLAEPSPAIGDLDGDGRMEVVAASYGGVYALDGPTGAKRWEFPLRGPYEISSPALGDLDGDGTLEVVLGSHDRTVYALDGRTGALRWAYPTRSKVWSSPTLADLDLDGRLEVLIASDKVYALNGLTGRLKWAFPLELGSISSPAVGDLDGDGKPEVVIAADDVMVYALKGRSGKEVWRFQVPFAQPQARGFIEHSSPALGDVDGDGRLEVAIGVSNRGLYLLDGRTGRVRWLFPIADLVRSSPAIGDLDGDG
ncbi:TPA: hypothetical protein EYP12_05085, partial [Candidatus Bipolaricaulota bacterium]|nr:hypothetical protein [Candidatus Bipolaricaulota bacterium]